MNALAKKLAGHVLHSRFNAVLAAMVFVFLPLLGWVAVAIMALVTLRKGAQEGAIVLLWLALPSVVLAIAGEWRYFVLDFLLGSAVVWLMAAFLRYSVSWPFLLQGTTLFGISLIFAAHVFYGDIAVAWQKHLATYATLLNKQINLGIEPAQLAAWTQQAAKIATGMQLALIVLNDLICLAIARWAQALLYNPGGLRQELHNIRLGAPIALLFILALLCAWRGYAVALDVLPIMVLPIFLAGLSLVHAVVASGKTKTPGLWLVGFYSLLVLFLPYVLVLLVIMVFVDMRVDFRARLQHALIK